MDTAAVAVAKAASAPAASMTESAPSPSVRSAIAAATSSSAPTVCVAPRARASRRRSGTESTATIRLGPYSDAVWIAESPTGPQPSTSTVAPGPCTDRRTAVQPVESTSPTVSACPSSIVSGTADRIRSPHGTRRYSACAPPRSPHAAPEPNTPPRGQRCIRPRRQVGQLPHHGAAGPTTRSPIRTCDTAPPISTTSPTYSWPRQKPHGVGMCPFLRWRSLPQIVVARIRRITSVGARNSGSGTSVTATVPCSGHTAARIAGPSLRPSGRRRGVRAGRRRSRRRRGRGQRRRTGPPLRRSWPGSAARRPDSRFAVHR
ncbi:hypothetical protein CJ468_00022 [Nocardia farcinica]|nr:hypothetical protein CJ468_00022 [Nocardia farcinica]